MGEAQKYLESLHNKTTEKAVKIVPSPDKPEDLPKKDSDKNLAAVELGRLGGLKGGKVRAENMTAEERSRGARNAANARWDKKQRFAGGLMPSTIEKAPKDDLYNAYVNEKLSYRDCCWRFKISKNTLKKLLIYYKIPSRDISESMKVIHSKNPNHGSKGQFKSGDSKTQIRKKKKKPIKSEHIKCNTCAYWEFIDEKMGICHGTPPLRRDNYDLTVDLEMGEKEEWMGYGKWFCTNSYDWCRLWEEKPIKKGQKFHINGQDNDEI